MALPTLSQQQWFRRLWVTEDTILQNDHFMFCMAFEMLLSDASKVALGLCSLFHIHGNETSKMFVPLDEIGVAIEYDAVQTS